MVCYYLKVQFQGQRVNDFIKVYSYIGLSTTCFGSSYEPSSGWLLFISILKYTISKAIVIVTCEISYYVYKKFEVKFIPLYIVESILFQIFYTRYTRSRR